jgi:sorting nexin-3/12
MSSRAQPTTARLQIRPQTLPEAYDPPANVLEVDVVNPETHGVAKNRYTDYEVKLKVALKQKTYSLKKSHLT